jgi:chromosome segregation ATPase
MISGFEALQSIDRAYAQLREEEMRLDDRLRSVSEEAARLRQERLVQLHRLAEVKFRMLKNGELARDLDMAEREVRRLLDEAEHENAQAAAGREKAAAGLKQAEATRTACAAEFEAAGRAFQAFETLHQPAIAAEAKWITLTGEAERAEKTWREAERKTRQAEEDRETKKTPYEADPLFVYLWKRQFGASAYRGGGIVRYFDGLIARMINYSQARANYAMLNQIPERLRAHVDRLKISLDALRQEIANFRQERLLAAGAGPMQARLREAQSAHAASEAEVAERQKEFATADAKYDAIIGKNSDGILTRAVQLMVDNDSRDDVITLYREAERTRSNEDKDIVAQIDHLTRQLGKTEADLTQLRAQSRELAGRREEIENTRASFRRRRYDYPGTTFRNEAAINDVLGGVLSGMIQGAVLEQVLQQGYRQPPSIDWGGGYQPGPMFPPGGFPGDGPDVFGGGDYGGSGGFDGGGSGDGFDTGGSF